MLNGVIRNIGPALLVAAAFAAGTPVAAQEGDQGESKPAVYGKTPDTVIPYRSFKEPYTRFFQELKEFYGYGRDEFPSELPRTARVGLLYPVGSAADADLGLEMLEGVKLAVEQANAAGGYEGIPFELIERLDVGLWGASSNEMVAFKYEDDVLAVIGSIDGANSHIALRVALKTQTPMVNTASTDPTLTETAIPWLLRCMADARQQGYALAHHIVSECGLEKVVAFRVNDRFGRMGMGEFRDAARRLKHPLRVELRWDRGDRDFSAQLDRIAETRPDAIMLWGNASDTAAVVREIRRRQRAGSDSLASVRIFGCDRLASRTFLEEAGDAAEGVVAVATYDPTRDDPRLKAFTEAFMERFDHEPGTFAAHAYDGANILVAAIRKGGLNRARIQDALNEYTHYDGVTGSIVFDTTLNDIGPVYMATVKQGRFVYREANFTKVSQRSSAESAGSAARQTRADDGSRGLKPAAPGATQGAPYRTLAESAPAARSPDRPTEGDPGTYRIGCFLPLDKAGQAAVRGVELAIADDASRHPHDKPIELVVRDAHGSWGSATSSLVDLVLQDNVLALIGSTERRATHLAEMLAAKLHFPVVTLCDTDPTITQIPLPWVFRVAKEVERPEVRSYNKMAPGFARKYKERFGVEADAHAAWGYDAGVLVASRIRAGADTRLTLRNRLADSAWNEGVSGTYRFDALGDRIDRRANSVRD
ncbi:MAG: ABC transporter substrate-binding protein [Planctomycetota bacterium]|jgi:ABC-type branched-subunit amino acid transport system substrate-binding protein